MQSLHLAYSAEYCLQWCL